MAAHSEGARQAVQSPGRVRIDAGLRRYAIDFWGDCGERDSFGLDRA